MQTTELTLVPERACADTVPVWEVTLTPAQRTVLKHVTGAIDRDGIDYGLGKTTILERVQSAAGL